MTTARTAKQIETAVFKATGYRFELVRGEGYCYFIFDDQGARYDTQSVAVMFFSTLSVEQWIDEARGFIRTIEDR
jgi:hypothetical protein